MSAPSGRAATTQRFDRLPGWELVAAGMADLSAGRVTVEAMLVASASRALAGVGVAVPGGGVPDAHVRLFELLEAEVGEQAAHGRYSALRRRLASFLRAAAHASAH